MMLMGYWSCAVQPGTAMTAHGDDEVRRHKGCRTFLLRPRAPRRSDPELPHAEANLPTRYPTHRKQRGGNEVERAGLECFDRFGSIAHVADGYVTELHSILFEPVVRQYFKGIHLEGAKGFAFELGCRVEPRL